MRRPLLSIADSTGAASATGLVSTENINVASESFTSLLFCVLELPSLNSTQVCLAAVTDIVLTMSIEWSAKVFIPLLGKLYNI